MRTFLSILFGTFITLVSLQSLGNPWYCSFSDEDMAYLVMFESREGYNGYCLCPTDYDGRGNQCGKNSAYLKPTPYVALCYADEVSLSMVDDFRSEHCPPDGKVTLDYE